MIGVNDDVPNNAPCAGDVLRVLQVINWGVFGMTAISAMSWVTVSLMMASYPELVAGAGGNFAFTYGITTVFSVLAVISAIALWLLMRRHAWLWYGQTALVLGLLGALGWAWQWI